MTAPIVYSTCGSRDWFKQIVKTVGGLVRPLLEGFLELALEEHMEENTENLLIVALPVLRSVEAYLCVHT
jgi:hypothetical protein